MPSFDEHKRKTVESGYSEDWAEVHLWLDGMAQQVGILEHRKYRHHREGIEEVRSRWGDEAAAAAELHIMEDCDGYVPAFEDYSTGTVNSFGLLVKHG